MKALQTNELSGYKRAFDDYCLNTQLSDNYFISFLRVRQAW